MHAVNNHKRFILSSRKRQGLGTERFEICDQYVAVIVSIQDAFVPETQDCANFVLKLRPKCADTSRKQRRQDVVLSTTIQT